MNICGRHEHRQLNAPAFEIFRLVNFLEGHHAAVGRGHDHIFAVTREIAVRRTVEIDNQQIEHRRGHCYQNRNPHPVDKPYPQGYVDKQQCRHQQYQYVGAFAMNLNSHQYLRVAKSAATGQPTHIFYKGRIISFYKGSKISYSHKKKLLVVTTNNLLTLNLIP